MPETRKIDPDVKFIHSLDAHQLRSLMSYISGSAPDAFADAVTRLVDAKVIDPSSHTDALRAAAEKDGA
jgi:hypothetical protein